MEDGDNVKTLHVAIQRPWQDVYAFAADLRNFPLWATTFCKSVRQTEDGWQIETPTGSMAIRLAETNAWGVLDHYVSPAPGVEIYVPMRVVADGHHSMLLFTLFRSPDMSDENWSNDLAMVEQDLFTLKRVLESGSYVA